MGKTYRYDKHGKQHWDGKHKQPETECNCGKPSCAWCADARTYHNRTPYQRNDQWPDDEESWDE